jgi:hypothetical protein
MVVFANSRIGPSAELLVSDDVATAMLHEVVAMARPVAEARWERELVRWLEGRTATKQLDVNDIAWTPEHFETQRRFLTTAIARAAFGSEHGPALDHWRRLIDAHPRDSVQVGRRWQWDLTA